MSAVMLLRALALVLLFSVLCAWSAASFARSRTVVPGLQLLGACFLVLVGIVHAFEALHWLAFMHWGAPHSTGHYLDFTSALLGLTVFPAAVLLRVLLRCRA